MNPLPRPATLVWLALVVAACAFVGWSAARQTARLERISELVPGAPADAASPTGLARGMRNLLLPERGTAGQAWVMDVQAMAAKDAWTATRADYDNAPEGRAVHGASPYRWWLRLLAGGSGQAVEQAALIANPVLHALLCIVLGGLVAWRFGAPAGGLFAAAVATVFPFNTAFAAGLPGDHGLFLGANLVALVLLLGGGWTDGRVRRPGLWFALAGAAGGFGLWIDPGSQLIALAAVAAGAVVAVGLGRATPGASGASLPWRQWAVGGAGLIIIGWALEGRPGGFVDATLDTVHPLLAIAWLGLAEVLMSLQRWRQSPAQRRLLIPGAVALAVTAGLLTWLTVRHGVPISFGPDGSLLGAFTTASSLTAWIGAGGGGAPLLATLLPVLIVVAALVTDRANLRAQPLRLLLLGAGAGLLVLACCNLRWWGLLDVAWLALLATVLTVPLGGFGALGWRSALAVLLLPGAVLAWPRHTADEEISPEEARLLIERDLAQWLAARTSPGAIVYASPVLSGSLCYYGGLRVVGSPYPGNPDGLALAARIASITSADEAQALFERRGIRYIVLTESDRVLDELARLGAEAPERSLIALLRQWLPPRWLRPVPYQMPAIGGLEGDFISVFEVVEPQENVVALSRLAEYFAEVGLLDLAAAVGDSLEQNFPLDAGAMIARIQVAFARNETRMVGRIVPQLLPAIDDGRDEDLPWERRANLAVVLAQVKQTDRAKQQLAFCLEEADPERLRSLGTRTLYRLLTLARAYDMTFADPTLLPEALALLPEEFRAKFAP